MEHINDIIIKNIRFNISRAATKRELFDTIEAHLDNRGIPGDMFGPIEMFELGHSIGQTKTDQEATTATNGKTFRTIVTTATNGATNSRTISITAKNGGTTSRTVCIAATTK